MTFIIRDTIKFNGEVLDIRPPDLSKISSAHVQSCLAEMDRGRMGGYKAHWEVRGNQVWLIEFNTRLGNRTHLRLEDLFPSEDSGVLAYWMSETIEIPQGEWLDSGCSIYVSEETILLNIDKGFIINRSLRNNVESARLSKEKDDADSLRMRARIAERKQRQLEGKEDPRDELPPESPIEAEAWEYLFQAMLGEIDAETIEEWEQFLLMARKTATKVELDALELTDRAIRGAE